MANANVDYWRTFSEFDSNSRIIANQPQDVITFRSGDNIDINFNTGTDTITWSANLDTISQDVRNDLSARNVTRPSNVSVLAYDSSTGVFTYYPPDLSSYATTTYVDNAVIDGIANIDLSIYATETWVQGYVGTAVPIPDMTQYVEKSEYNTDLELLNDAIDGIPRGYTGSIGPPGSSVKIVGTVADYSILVTRPRWTNYIGELGDGVLLADTGNLAVATSLAPPTQWTDVGSILGYTGSQGLRGYNGSQGDRGYTGSAIIIGHLVYEQNVASDVWTINHNLGVQYLSVELVDDNSNSIVGTYGYPTVTFVDQNNLTITWSQPSTGYAVLSAGGGEDGYTGSQGIQGPQGNVGYTGSVGFTGSTGAYAALGFTGSQGATGAKGFTGSQGNIGFTGSSGGLPTNVNIATEDITLTVSSNADLANVANAISEYRLTSYQDFDGSRAHAPIIYVDIDPGTYTLADYFSIEHMIPNVRFRSNGGDSTNTIIEFSGQFNIISSNVRFDGLSLNFSNWLNVIDYAELKIGYSTLVEFESAYVMISNNSMILSKNVNYGYVYWDMFDKAYFKVPSGSDFTGSLCDWYVSNNSEVNIQVSGTKKIEFNDVYIDQQSSLYTRSIGTGVDSVMGTVSISHQSKWSSQASGTGSNVDVFEATVDYNSDADIRTNFLNITNPTNGINVFKSSRFHIEGEIKANLVANTEIDIRENSTFYCHGADVDYQVLVGIGSTFTAINDVNIGTSVGTQSGTLFGWRGAHINVGDNLTVNTIDLEDCILSVSGPSTNNGDISCQTLTAYFGCDIRVKNDFRPDISGGISATTTEINLIDSQMFVNRVLKCGQCNLLSSDLRSEDGIQFSETNGYLQCYSSFIGLEGPISQDAFVTNPNSNGIYLEGCVLMMDASITTGYLTAEASTIKTSGSLTLTLPGSLSSILQLYGGTELHVSLLTYYSPWATTGNRGFIIDNGSKLHVNTYLGGSSSTITANINLNHGSTCFIEDNSSANNIGNCNVTTTNFSEFFSPLGRVSDY